MNCRLITLLASLCLVCSVTSDACRLGSEKLISYTRLTVERLINAERLRSIYWPVEPLDTRVISRATGINITYAGTSFDYLKGQSQNEIGSDGLIQDIFVTCSTSRDRKHTLSINLELNNPFTAIELGHRMPEQEEQRLRILMPKSNFLVHLNQRISYDECLDIKYVQLAPNSQYAFDWGNCGEEAKRLLDLAFKKKVTQLDAALNALLSEKLQLGLQELLSQERLDLDLYV